MINSFALEVTVDNPYHDLGVKMEFDSNYRWDLYSQGSVESSFTNGHVHRVKIGDAVVVASRIKFEPQITHGNIVSYLLQQDIANKGDSVTKKRYFTGIAHFNGRQVEYTYNIRVREKDAKIKSVKVDVLKVTINGVDLAVGILFKSQPVVVKSETKHFTFYGVSTKDAQKFFQGQIGRAHV